MSTIDRIRLAVRLQTAIDNMAGRYGIACMDQAYARTPAERAAANRKACRQYRALMRLTTALSNLAIGGTL